MQKLTYLEDEKGNFYGLAGCSISTECFLHLLSNIEKVNFIKEKFFLFGPHYLNDIAKRQSISMEYFNVEDQTLYFPHDKFLEDIKTKIENDEDKGILEKKISRD